MRAWTDYSAVELEAQFNVRAALPEHTEIIAGWQSRSAAYRHRCERARLDLRYGSQTGETLDFFPASAAHRPLHVFIHGGYWQRMDKADFSFVAAAFNARQVNTALLNYALCPAVPLAHIVDQARRALVWLWRNASALGFDRERIQLAGHSAGGHLTAMLLATDWPALEPPMPRDPVRSALPISGIYELEPLVPTSINQALGLDRAQARSHSPLYLAPMCPAATVVAVGGAETEEFQRQARALVVDWARQEAHMELLELPGLNHFTILEELGEPGGSLLETALRLL